MKFSNQENKKTEISLPRTQKKSEKHLVDPKKKKKKTKQKYLHMFYITIKYRQNMVLYIGHRNFFEGVAISALICLLTLFLSKPIYQFY